jgi:DNA-binding NarL/FixJ family response regulator
MTKPELEELRENLNLTDDEDLVFVQLSKGRNKTYIADNCMISISTVDNRIKAINLKLKRLEVI